jgi:hypothetical protein
MYHTFILRRAELLALGVGLCPGLGKQVLRVLRLRVPREFAKDPSQVFEGHSVEPMDVFHSRVEHCSHGPSLGTAKKQAVHKME